MINIRDPIHDFIQLDDFEAKILQASEFQRLRSIGQLGTTSWVYPGSTHSRFEHSLGVFHLAKIALEALKTIEIELEPEDGRIFSIASLLHDIGHAPFSHFGEETKLFNEGLNHELMGEAIIRESPIGGILKKDTVLEENFKEMRLGSGEGFESLQDGSSATKW